jgi:hypothetical protein
MASELDQEFDEINQEVYKHLRVFKDLSENTDKTSPLVDKVEGLLLLAVDVVHRANELNGGDEEVLHRYNRSLAKIRQDLFFACGIWTLVDGLPPKNYLDTEKI